MKKQIIAHMREHAGMGAEEAETALAAAASAIATVANRDGSARVPGLGTFKVKLRAARPGRNPQTGETIQLAEKRVLSFKESKGS